MALSQELDVKGIETYIDSSAKVIRMYHVQAEIANKLEISYYRVKDTDLSRKVRMMAVDAKNQHRMTIGLFKKYRVTAVHVVDDMVPLLRLAVETRDSSLGTAGFEVVLEDIKEMKEETKQARESYVKLSSTVHETIEDTRSNLKDTKTIEEDEEKNNARIKKIEAEQAELEAIAKELKVKLKNISSGIKSRETKYDDEEVWVTTMECDKVQCKNEETEQGTTTGAAIGGAIGAATGSIFGPVGATIGACAGAAIGSLFGRNKTKKGEELKESVKVTTERKKTEANKKSVKDTREKIEQDKIKAEETKQEYDEKRKAFDKKEKEKEKISADSEELAKKKDKLGSTEFLKVAEGNLGLVVQQLDNMIEIWDNLEAFLTQEAKRSKTGKTLTSTKMEHEKVQQMILKKIDEAEKVWALFGALCEAYIEQSGRYFGPLYHFLGICVDDMSETEVERRLAALTDGAMDDLDNSLSTMAI